MNPEQGTASGQADTVELTEEIDCDVTAELPLDAVATCAQSSSVGGPWEPGIEASTTGGGSSEVAVLCARYALEGLLGNGGMAQIFRARDLTRNALNDAGWPVAIKRLRPGLHNRPGSIARLRREFDQTRSLMHPNIVRFHDFGCDRGIWFIAMELLDGETLGDRLRRAGPEGLPRADALRIARDCGDALEFAHRNGVTHGDVKPDNVFVTAVNEVRMLDFGVADSHLATTPVPGTAGKRIAPAATRKYASPEVLAGQRPEPRDDVFGLACTVYEMLAGRHPYGRRGADEARVAGVAITRPSGLGNRQWRALRSGLAWSRDQRPLTVRGLLNGLGSGAEVTRCPRSLSSADGCEVPA